MEGDARVVVEMPQVLKGFFFQLLDILGSVFIFALLHIQVHFELRKVRLIKSISFRYSSFDFLS